MDDIKEEIKTTQYSVVVVGAMNPAIHTPQWYRAVGMLTEDEEQQALSSEDFVVIHHQLAQFQTKTFKIQCTPDRWLATTTLGQQRKSIIDLAAQTFDRLSETPVSAYGLNARFTVSNNVENLITALGSIFSKKPLDLTFNQAAPDFGSLSISYSLPPVSIDQQPKVERQLKTTISCSPQALDVLTVNINGHHQIELSDSYFDLALLIRASVELYEKEDSLLKHILMTLANI